MTLDFMCAGDMVAGLLMADPAAKFPATLETLEAGQVIKIPRATYMNYWSQSPEVMHRVQRANLNRMRSLHLLREAAAFPLEKKLAWTVVKYLKKTAANQQRTAVRFSRKDLSELVGTTTESVIRVLSLWKAENLVVVEDGTEYFESEALEQRYFGGARL
jgi:CRP-like cAMP-binding protein